MKLTFGDKLILALRHRGMTQEELAKKTFFSESTISRYIKDKGAPPDYIRAVVLARALNMDPSYFIKEVNI